MKKITKLTAGILTLACGATLLTGCGNNQPASHHARTATSQHKLTPYERQMKWDYYKFKSMQKRFKRGNPSIFNQRSYWVSNVTKQKEPTKHDDFMRNVSILDKKNGWKPFGISYNNKMHFSSYFPDTSSGAYPHFEQINKNTFIMADGNPQSGQTQGQHMKDDLILFNQLFQSEYSSNTQVIEVKVINKNKIKIWTFDPNPNKDQNQPFTKFAKHFKGTFIRTAPNHNGLNKVAHVGAGAGHVHVKVHDAFSHNNSQDDP